MAGFGHIVIAVGLVITVAGCSTLGAPEDPSELVARRAKERWQALIEQNLDKAYGYLSPGSRQALSIDGYKARIRTGMWKAADVDQVSCEASACKVTVKITYDHRKFRNVQTQVIESWLIAEGNAWFVLQE
jgi:hypothetical protein